MAVLLYIEQETTTRAKVVGQHYQPETLTAEEKANGIEVASFTQPVHQFGKIAQSYVNPSTGEQWVEYIDRELTDEEKKLNPDDVYKNIFSNKSLYTLSELKGYKKRQLDYLCNQSILGNFSSSANGTALTYTFDYEAQTNFNGAMNMFNAGLITSVEWTTKEAGRVSLTKTQFFSLCGDAFSHKDSKIKKYHSLLPNVDAATTALEVDAVVW